MTDGNGATPLVPSDEGDEKGLELGRAQGEALTRTLRHMTGEIAHDGREVQSGEYLVAYAVEEAEGMYVPDGDGLEWSEPDGRERAYRGGGPRRRRRPAHPGSQGRGDGDRRPGAMRSEPTSCRCSGIRICTITGATGPCPRMAATRSRCASARRPSRGTTGRTGGASSRARKWFSRTSASSAARTDRARRRGPGRPGAASGAPLPARSAGHSTRAHFWDRQSAAMQPRTSRPSPVRTMFEE